MRDDTCGMTGRLFHSIFSLAFSTCITTAAHSSELHGRAFFSSTGSQMWLINTGAGATEELNVPDWTVGI